MQVVFVYVMQCHACQGMLSNYCCFHQSSAWAVDFRYVSAGECEEHPHERQRSHMGLNVGSKTFVTKRTMWSTRSWTRMTHRYWVACTIRKLWVAWTVKYRKFHRHSLKHLTQKRIKAVDDEKDSWSWWKGCWWWDWDSLGEKILQSDCPTYSVNF